MGKGKKPIESPRCTKCVMKPCYRDTSLKGAPKFCPILTKHEIIEEALKIYKQDESLRKLHHAATLIESEGYGEWPRVKEVVELCKKLNVTRVGIAFCIGLSDEARILDEILESWDLQVYSVCCKCGSIDKRWLGINENEKLRPGSHEAMCNPILQALLLNSVGTELNVVVGLCVGHDSIFMRYSKAPVVYLIAKDRVTGHNPVAALYARRYFRKRILP